MTSHEIRNPLAAILQSADSIASTMDEAIENSPRGSKLELDKLAVESISESAATIMVASQLQRSIVDDILTLSKLDASLITITPVEVDPISTIQHALQLHQQEFKRAGVEGFVHVDGSYDGLHINRVFLDPSRLLQVLINLITNAIKLYVPPALLQLFITDAVVSFVLTSTSTQYQTERRVTLHLGASLECPAQDDDYATYFAPRVVSQKPQSRDSTLNAGEDLFLRFAIEDTGCGLNEEEIHRIFTRFTQASPKTHVQYGVSL